MSSDQSVHTYLSQYATRVDNGWVFPGGPHEYPHNTDDALRIVQACKYLGVEPTDFVTVKAWFSFVSKVRDLETRLAEIDLRTK